MKYEIKKGDTLWRLAKEYYGNPLQWESIFADNIEKLEGNPDILKIGTIINIRRKPLSLYKQINLQIDYWRQWPEEYKGKIWQLEDALITLLFLKSGPILGVITLIYVIWKGAR